METLLKLEEEPKDKETLTAINKSIEGYESGFGKIIEKIKSGAITTSPDANKAIGEYKESIHQAEKNITDYATANDATMEKVKKELDSDKQHAVIIIISIIALSFIIVMIMTITLILSIKRPLTQIDQMVTDIAQGDGDLTARLPYKGKDELGEICDGFNLFIEKLHSVISQIASTSTQVASAASQLNATAEQIATGSEEVAAQAATIATAGEEMAATSGDIAQNCQIAVEAANSASHTAQRGFDVVQKTITGIKVRGAKSKDNAVIVGSLGTRSEQIGAIVGTIEDIADQTNLLALNAAIEAARAGEQGRGFAVVADEVRALAERTTRATKEISGMIRAIQTETQHAISSLEEGVKETERGAEEASQMETSLNEILEQVSSVAMQVSQIATAAEEQTATTNEISSNMHMITEVVQQTSHGAQDSSAAATQLHGNAEELQRLVRQFKL